MQDIWCYISYYPPEKWLSIVLSCISQHASFHESLTVNKNWTEQRRYFQLIVQRLAFVLLPGLTLVRDACQERARLSHHVDDASLETASRCIFHNTRAAKCSGWNGRKITERKIVTDQARDSYTVNTTIWYSYDN